MTDEPDWLIYARKLNSIAKAGLTYSEDKYDIERFEEIEKISADIIKKHTELQQETIEEVFISEKGYSTPKVDIRAVIFKNDKILLVKEKIDGLWSLPGGWAEVNLSVSENLKKEAKEEAGAEIKPKRVIAIQDRNKHNTPPSLNSIYKIFVECELIKMDFKENIETSEVGFFKLDKLPPLSIERNNREQIEMCFEAKDKKYHQTIFD